MKVVSLLITYQSGTAEPRFLQEKGTDRVLLSIGQKNKYSWVDKGSSYLLSDLLAAVLYAQLSHEEEIKAKQE